MSEDTKTLLEWTDKKDVVDVLQASRMAQTTLRLFLEANDSRKNYQKPIRSVRTRIGQKSTVSILTGEAIGAGSTAGASRKFSSARDTARGEDRTAEEGADYLALLLDNALPSEAAMCASVLYVKDGLRDVLQSVHTDVADAIDSFLKAQAHLANVLYAVDESELPGRQKKSDHGGRKVSPDKLAKAQAMSEQYRQLTGKGKASDSEEADNEELTKRQKQEVRAWASLKYFGEKTGEELVRDNVLVSGIRSQAGLKGMDHALSLVADRLNSKQIDSLEGWLEKQLAD